MGCCSRIKAYQSISKRATINRTAAASRTRRLDAATAEADEGSAKQAISTATAVSSSTRAIGSDQLVALVARCKHRSTTQQATKGVTICGDESASAVGGALGVAAEVDNDSIGAAGDEVVVTGLASRQVCAGAFGGSGEGYLGCCDWGSRARCVDVIAPREPIRGQSGHGSRALEREGSSVAEGLCRLQPTSITL